MRWRAQRSSHEQPRLTWRVRAGLYPADPVEAAAQEMVQQAANDLEGVEPIFNGFTKEVCADAEQSLRVLVLLLTRLMRTPYISARRALG